MATATKKKTSKKTAKNTPFEVELEMTRETKNTYRFENDSEDAVIPTLYIQKSAFSTEPSSVTITVTPS